MVACMSASEYLYRMNRTSTLITIFFLFYQELCLMVSFFARFASCYVPLLGMLMTCFLYMLVRYSLLVLAVLID